MYPVGNDEKRLGYWGKKTLRWPPMIAAFWYSNSCVISSFEYGLDWLTRFYNRSDGTLFLRLGERLWLLSCSVSVTVSDHSLKGRPAPTSCGSFMVSPHGESPKLAKNYISEFRSGSSWPAKPSDGTAAPALSLNRPHEKLEPEAPRWWYLDFWLMEWWDNVLFLQAAEFGDNLLHSNR